MAAAKVLAGVVWCSVARMVAAVPEELLIRHYEGASTATVCFILKQSGDVYFYACV